MKRFAVAVFALIATSAMALQPPHQDRVPEFGGFSGASSAPLAVGASFTIEAWVFPTASQNSTVVAGSPSPTQGFFDYALVVNGNRFAFTTSTGTQSTSSSAISPVELTLRRWTHVAGVLGGGTMTLLIDGSPVSSRKGTTPPSSSTNFVVGSSGSEACFSCSGFDGAIRDVRVWSRALTAAELVANASSLLPADRNGLSAAWPLDEGAGLAARNLAGGAALQLGRNGANVPRWVTAALFEAGPFFTVSQVLPISSPPGVSLNTGRLIDFDTDGDLDLIATRSDMGGNWTAAPVFAARNDGHGAFTDATSGVFSENPPRSIAARDYVVGDFTGDGRSDFFVADQGPDRPPFEGGPNLLLVQDATGHVIDRSGSLPSNQGFTHSVAAADFNGDGSIDLYTGDICCAGNPTLLINDGTGVLRAEPWRLPEKVTTRTTTYAGSLALDVDRDGDADIVLGTGGGDPREALLLNDGTGRFSFAPTNAMPERPTSFRGLSTNLRSADFDNDGSLDIVLRYETGDPSTGQLVLLLNNGNGTFRNATDRIPRLGTTELNYTGIAWPHPVDVNGDGLVDLIVEGGDGNPVPRLLINTGVAFMNVSEVLPMNLLGNSILPGDLDGDGLVDLLRLGGPALTVVKGTKRFPLNLILALPRRRSSRH